MPDVTKPQFALLTLSPGTIVLVPCRTTMQKRCGSCLKIRGAAVSPHRPPLPAGRRRLTSGVAGRSVGSGSWDAPFYQRADSRRGDQNQRERDAFAVAPGT